MCGRRGERVCPGRCWRVQVDHPNIVKLHQIFDCPKIFYMVRHWACTDRLVVSKRM